MIFLLQFFEIVVALKSSVQQLENRITRKETHMPFTNKEIKFDEFMRQLRQRIEKSNNSAALLFF